ncbi:MAG: winged helix-turn-helix transcriptional regulator [Nitrospirae bacterium]|nr:winged helix-turn-helix transcriptional regulator [Nitrospirota bacterium]
MNKKISEIHADICKTLGNSKRIEILNALGNRELSVSQLVAVLGIAPANVSQHLAVMRQKGILTSQRNGNNIFYKISNPKVIKACSLMREVLLERFKEGGRIARRLSGK